MSLAQRSDAAELMDTDCTDDADYQACLADLSKVNTVTLARHPTLAWLNRAARSRAPGEPISVFDVAYGHGDMLRAIAAWAARRDRPVKLGGIDLNPGSKAAASSTLSRSQERVGRNAEPDLRTGNVLAHDPGPGWDYIVSSLFAHHLADAEIIDFLRWMERHAERGWFINDLHRHIVPHAVFRAGSRLLGWHRFVQHDGAVSIARAFRPAEWRRLLAEAGVPGRIRWRFPFRLCVERLK